MEQTSNRKASDAQILQAYAELASVKKVGARLGMCGQSVHERLIRLNAINHIRPFTEAEESRLLQDYDRLANEGRIGELAAELGRTRQYLARQARRLGLTRQRRKRSYIIESTSARFREWHKTNPHPRGMLGKTYSEATKEKFRNRIASEETKTKLSDRALRRWHSMSAEEQIVVYGRRKQRWRSGWREIGGRRIFCRSRWEANYARYLEWLRQRGEIAKWEHEPKVFWFLEIKRGTRSYLPDFRITENDGLIAYHEVKGWMDQRSKTKIRRMAKYYPDVKLIVVTSTNYRALERLICRMIEGWEHSTR